MITIIICKFHLDNSQKITYFAPKPSENIKFRVPLLKTIYYAKNLYEHSRPTVRNQPFMEMDPFSDPSHSPKINDRAMKPYFYDMMIAVGLTDPRWIQLLDQEYRRDTTILKSAKALNQALDKLVEENPRLKLRRYSQPDLLALMRAHYQRYTWMEKQGCFYLTPEESGYPEVMLRMNRTTGSKTGLFYPGVIYCKGNRSLLKQRLHILAGSNQPYGFDGPKAIVKIMEVMKTESCTPIIPLSTGAGWDLVTQSVKQAIPAVIILDKGLDSYLENPDPVDQALIDNSLRQGGLLMTNRRVGENQPLKFPEQYRLYFMFALATRMHLLQVSPKDNSRFLMEAAINHSVHVTLLSQPNLPPKLPEYYRQLPSAVQQVPLVDWLRL